MMIGLIGASMASGFIMTRTGRYRLLPTLATAVLTVGLLLLANMQLDTPSWLVAIYMFLVGAGIGPVNSVSVTATQNAVARDVVGTATAGTTLFRQIGGSIGVSIFGAIFTSGLAARLGDVMPAGSGTGTGSFSAQAVAALPEPVRNMVLEAFASALHPVFYTAAGAAILAFGLSFLLEERPLATTLRKEPEAIIDAEEESTGAMVGAPIGATR